MVTTEEDVGLVGVFGREGDEEINDLSGMGTSVAVVAQEDDEGGVER